MWQRRKAKNTPRENLFVTLDTHQPNYMETNEGRHLPVPHCIEGTEGHALDGAIVCRFRRRSGVPHHPQADVRLGGSAGHAPRAAGTADGNSICRRMHRHLRDFQRHAVQDGISPEANIVIDAALCACVTPESHDTALNAMRLCQMEILPSG